MNRRTYMYTLKPNRFARKPKEKLTAWKVTVASTELIHRPMVSESLQHEEWRDVTLKDYCLSELNESQPGDLSVATSLNVSGKIGVVAAREANFTKQPMEWSKGSAIGNLTRIKTDQVRGQLLKAEGKERRADLISKDGDKMTGH